MKFADPRSLLLSERYFGKIVFSLVGLGFAALLMASIMASLTVARGQDHNRSVSHTYDVERELSNYRLLLERAETARRGYLLTGDGRFATILGGAVDGIPQSIGRIDRLTRDNPRQQTRAAELRTLTAGQLRLLQSTVDLVAAGQQPAAMQVFRSDINRETIQRIRVVALEMVDEEMRLLALRTEQQRENTVLFYIVEAVAGLLILFVGISSLWVILRYTRALTTSQRELKELNDNLEGAVRERTADLQRANEEIQRFAYIVSHDLRSPLVNVMGFTAELEAAARQIGELIDRVERDAPAMITTDARVAAREDLPEAISFIRTSTEKMDRLINAILKLSREGRRIIAPEWIDTAALVANIRDSLQHRLDSKGAVLEIADLPDACTDRFALEQILSNLVDNSVKYLSPARPGHIVVRGYEEGARLMIEVEDNGRGIDPRDHDRVFDLFRRSGAQDQPGEGIGLAHVRALAYRLGGMIDCRSQLDGGATFRLSLPLNQRADEGIPA